MFVRTRVSRMRPFRQPKVFLEIPVRSVPWRCGLHIDHSLRSRFSKNLWRHKQLLNYVLGSIVATFANACLASLLVGLVESVSWLVT